MNIQGQRFFCGLRTRFQPNLLLTLGYGNIADATLNKTFSN